MRFLLRFVLLAVVGCGLLPATLLAANYESHYVVSAELSPLLLPPPPAEGSPAWKKNVEGVLAAQRHISKIDRAAMRDEQHMRLDLMTGVLGQDFTPAKYPRSFALLENVFEDSETITGVDKKYWHTRRPYLTDKRVRLMVDPIDQNPAYPSGHTSASRVVAEILGLLFPDRLAALRTRAESIAQHRIEAGVHYPGDVEGGRLLAMLITGALIKSDDFNNDLADAREELAERPLLLAHP